MDDCIAAIAVPQTATPYVRPSALVYTVESGAYVLHVLRGREETLRLLAAKRAKTRDERYLMSIKIAEDSALPEQADAPAVTVASTNAVQTLMEATFDVMPHLERVHQLVYRETPGLDAFVLPRAPEVQSGFGVIRTHAGPVLEMLHSREQAEAFLKRHEALIDKDDMETAGDQFSLTPLIARSRRQPEAFGGFAAAVIGARYRLLTELGLFIR
jgi:hypothetical protein